MLNDIPVCAVCGRPVEHFKVIRDDARGLYLCEAQCHGATQRVVLTYMAIQRAGPRGIRLGYAFDDVPALPMGEESDPGPSSEFDLFAREMMRQIADACRPALAPKTEGESK